MKKTFLIFALFLFVNVNAQWITYTLPYYGYAYTIGFYNLNTGISFGHTAPNFTENIYYTTNSGLNWIYANYPFGIRAIVDMQFINSSLVYACGAENGPFKLSGGLNNDFKNYTELLRQKLLHEGKREFYSDYKSVFIKSTNSGISWSKAGNFDTLTGYINSIRFFDANTGYALIDTNPSENTKFYKTSNGGTNWQMVSQIELVTEKENLFFFDKNTGFAIGTMMFPEGNMNFSVTNDGVGRIYKTTNGGLNWTISIFTPQISSLTFFNSTTGIALGNTSGLQNLIYKTTDAGNNWNVVYSFSSRHMQKIKSLPSTGIAFAVGFLFDTVNFTIKKFTTLKTTNYGTNWIIKDLNPPANVPGLSLIDENNFFVSGSDESTFSAIILKSTNGGNVFVNQIGTETPSSFKLFQNYPNPFNPSTKIRFDIPAGNSIKNENNLVTLKVYDVLGREIAVLINERLQPGTYEMPFSIDGNHSGVYFYALESGGLKQTKKMLFIK